MFPYWCEKKLFQHGLSSTLSHSAWKVVFPVRRSIRSGLWGDIGHIYLKSRFHVFNRTNTNNLSHSIYFSSFFTFYLSLDCSYEEYIHETILNHCAMQKYVNHCDVHHVIQFYVFSTR